MSNPNIKTPYRQQILSQRQKINDLKQKGLDLEEKRQQFIEEVLRKNRGQRSERKNKQLAIKLFERERINLRTKFRRAKDKLRGLKSLEDKLQGKKFTAEEIRKGVPKKVKRQEKSFTVSLGGARNEIEKRVETSSRGKTITTFINRDSGGVVQVSGDKRYSQLSNQAKKTLSRGKKLPFTPTTNKEKKVKNESQVTTKDLLDELGIKRKLYSEGFTKEELKQIKNAADKTQAVKVIQQLQRDKIKAEKQKLDSFLKASTKKIATQADVNRINKAIDAELKRLKDVNLKLSVAKGDFSKELKQYINTYGDRSLELLSPSFVKKVSVELGKIIYDVTVKPVKASYNYGRNLVKRGIWSKNNNPFLSDIKSLAGGTKNITQFVLKNPAETAMIVGIASAVVGTSILKTIRTKPEKALAEAIFILSPLPLKPQLIKPITKSIQLVKSHINSLKNAKTPAQIKKAFDTLKLNVGIYLKNREKYVKGKLLSGKDKEKVLNKFKKFEKERNYKVFGGTVTNEKVAGFIGYDIKTKSTPKTIKTINLTKLDDIRVLPSTSQMGAKLNSISSKKELRLAIKNLRDSGYKVFRKKLDREIIDLNNGFIQKYKYIVTKGKRKISKTEKGKLSRKQKKAQKREERKALKKSKVSITGNKVKEKELFDERGRTEFWKKTLKDAETKAELAPLFKSINKKGQLTNKYVSRKSEDIIKIKKKSNFKKKRYNTKVKNLRRGHKEKVNKKKTRKEKAQLKKKQQNELIKEDKKYKKELEKDILLLKKELRKIKKIKKVIKSNPKKKLGVKGLILRLTVLERSIKKVLAEKLKDLQKIDRGIKSKQEEKSKLDKIIKVASRVRFSKATGEKLNLKSPQKLKTTFKPKTKPPRPPKKPTKPPKKPPIKPKRIPIPDLSFNTKLKQGERLSFDIAYRERRNISKPYNKKSNPVIKKVIKTKLPFNKALRKALRGVDKSTQRSLELQISGITKAKDLTRKPKELNKFRSRKTNKVLRLVEKSKYAIDTKGEKQGLSLTRVLGKKRSKKVKVSRKTKKSSRNRSKGGKR